MRKEVIFAILSGSLLGLVIAFGVWRANQAFKAGRVTEQKQETKEDKKTLVTNQFDLTIASPENYSIFTKASASVSGVTRPSTFIVASTEDEDTIVQADTKGSFTADVSLGGGINPLKISSLDPKNGSAEKSLNLIYSSEFKKFLATKSETTEASSEADVVREKVKEKLAEAQNKPVAYIGTITDLTDKAAQIRNEDGEIMQVSLSPTTEYVKSTTETKKIEFKDVAIGDYVAALGFKENGEVLSGKRIIVTTKTEDIKQIAVLGQVEKVDTKKKEIAIKDNHGDTWTAQFGKKWDGPNLKDIEEGKRVIAVGTKSDLIISSTRTLYVIEE